MLVRRCKPIVLELNDQYQVSYMRVPNLVLSQCWASLSYGVAEFRRLGKIRFQSTRLKYGLQSIQELIIIGSIYTQIDFLLRSTQTNLVCNQPKKDIKIADNGTIGIKLSILNQKTKNHLNNRTYPTFLNPNNKLKRVKKF